MDAALKLAVWLAIAWAIGALTFQVLAARGAGRREYSRAAGSPWRGLWYNFTVAMLPGHKESARLHPLEFAGGVVLHAGVLGAAVQLLWLLLAGTTAEAGVLWLRWMAGLGAAAGVGLLIRRLNSPLMRAISAPDDYLAILATIGFELVSVCSGWWAGRPLLAYAALFLAYLPLGKLRHAVFFFAARAEYGWRLGHRGVYPPADAGAR